ncbi:MAG TPA: DUF3850 domain-containing protein [Polyangiaceae bacterium]|nr:DUF3850 domain-containing protein [Polyangiaceae bacterium]
MTHSLKTHPEPFLALRINTKSFEFRKHDRPFAVGDILELKEWDPSTERFTSQVEVRVVSYIVTGPKFGIPEGDCVMSLV